MASRLIELDPKEEDVHIENRGLLSGVTKLNPKDLLDDGHVPGLDISVTARIHQQNSTHHGIYKLSHRPTADAMKIILANTGLRTYHLGHITANTISSEIRVIQLESQCECNLCSEEGKYW
jgi:hypothetical protein